MLKKDITFIYMDSAEKSIMEPLAYEAKKRGYKIKITDNVFEKCEIGVYCQHINFPQYSKFSVIMLHDIIQQYSNWPDIWFLEPWNKYDIGILPSNQWVNNWNQVSKWFYTRPRVGMFKVGWPKADRVLQIQEDTDKTEICRKYNLDITKKTVLYAPAWENDKKQDDFVQAMIPLGVNILIKQWDANPEKFPEVAKNIKEMYELHKNIPGVVIMPPETNIFEAIAVSDVLVSEESSTMCEAVMMGIPAVSVSNWLIPDVIPSRYPKCDYDFVTMTTKEKLSSCVEEILVNYEDYQAKAQKFAKENFSNVGQSSKMIIDIIDDCVQGKPIRYVPISPKKKERVAIIKCITHWLIQCKITINSNYRVRYKVIDVLWRILKRIKDFILRKGSSK